MTTLTQFTSSHRRHGVLQAAGTLFADALQAWRYRRADRAMHHLSDEILHDIGVARSEIEDVTRHGRCPHG